MYSGTWLCGWRCSGSIVSPPRPILPDIGLLQEPICLPASVMPGQCFPICRELLGVNLVLPISTRHRETGGIAGHFLMKPLFTIHGGEYLVGSYIEQHFKRVNVWIPSRDKGADLLVTDRHN